MAIPDWFDPAYYAAQKVLQMNAIRYLGKGDWDVASYTQELLTWQDEMGNGLPGATADEKALANFLACNTNNYASWINQGAINVSCSNYFDVGVYVQNLATAANRGTISLGAAPSGGWTAESMLQHLLQDMHTSAWEHYTTAGAAAGINPSNTFDTNSWLEARATAMNEWQDKGWFGRTDWTAASVAADLANQGLNPVQDIAGLGGKTFNIAVTAPASATQLPESFINQWQPVLSPNPYDLNVAAVEMTQAQTSYSGTAGQNTRFEGVWTNVASSSTILPSDSIQGGANAYNTIAMELDANWPGFTTAARNIGRIVLDHGTANASSPYTFDAGNIQGLERIDLNAAGQGATNVKSLPGTVQTININGLESTQTTGIAFAAGAVNGSNDSLTLGVTNTGSQGAAAPVNISGIETLTVNAVQGQSYIDLRGTSGVQTLKAAGAGDLTITAVANGIGGYDASQATGNINIAASNLQPSTTVRGGYGWDTLTLTQSFKGAPESWSGIESLALNPGTSLNISAANISGLQNLWLHSGLDATISGLPPTGRFIVYQASTGASQAITVDGRIASLAYSTTGYAAEANGTATPRFSSNAPRDVDIHATGQTTLAGTFNLTQAAGDVSLDVQKDATFGRGTISARAAKSFTANVEGNLASGATFNVVAGAQGGSVEINAQNGIQANGRITLNAPAATSLSVSSGGAFALANTSSLQSVQTLDIALSGQDASFDAAAIAMVQANSVQIDAEGGSVRLGEMGSARLQDNIQITVSQSADFSIGNLQTGASGDILINVTATESSAFGNIQAAGNAQLTVQSASVNGNGNVAIRSGGDSYIDFSGVTGAAFSQSAPLNINSAESINYIGAQGADSVNVAHMGAGLPSSIQLGTGVDTLTIAANAVASGNQVSLVVDLGVDTDADSIIIRPQTSGARLSVYLDDFSEGQDRLQFSAASIGNASQAQTLLASFGVSGSNISQSMLCRVGNGTGILYDGDVYTFNATANASTMVVITGAQIENGSVNIAGAPETDAE